MFARDLWEGCPQEKGRDQENQRQGTAPRKPWVIDCTTLPGWGCPGSWTWPLFA